MADRDPPYASVSITLAPEAAGPVGGAALVV